jgi:hypothetical protein
MIEEPPQHYLQMDWDKITSWEEVIFVLKHLDVRVDPTLKPELVRFCKGVELDG